jgi:xanthine dehydrogenase YagS FAD-binding subunit
MDAISYERAPDAAAAIRSASQPGVVFIGGGTNLLDLMKGGVARPVKLVDITHIDGMDRITPLPDGGLRIGALATATQPITHGCGSATRCCRRRFWRARRRNCATWRPSAAT